MLQGLGLMKNKFNPSFQLQTSHSHKQNNPMHVAIYEVVLECDTTKEVAEL